MTAEAFAPAKINLTLHVTGQRADGLHLLDSLVVFADLGDRIRADAADEFSLRVTGPFAERVPFGDDNLVLRAARMMASGKAAAFTLEKNLPSAAGVGGGSSDAAATMRALADLWPVTVPEAAATAILGADVPVCMSPNFQRMRGIGESVMRMPPLPPLWAVLVNDGNAVPTGEVFARLTNKHNAPMPEKVPNFVSARALVAWMQGMRNDLQVPAIEIAPGIGRSIGALLRLPEILMARMTGSGGTVFGLFPSAESAKAAAVSLARTHPDWWVRDAGLR